MRGSLRIASTAAALSTIQVGLTTLAPSLAATSRVVLQPLSVRTALGGLLRERDQRILLRSSTFRQIDQNDGLVDMAISFSRTRQGRSKGEAGC